LGYPFVILFLQLALVGLDLSCSPSYSVGVR